MRTKPKDVVVVVFSRSGNNGCGREGRGRWSHHECVVVQKVDRRKIVIGGCGHSVEEGKGWGESSTAKVATVEGSVGERKTL